MLFLSVLFNLLISVSSRTIPGVHRLGKRGPGADDAPHYRAHLKSQSADASDDDTKLRFDSIYVLSMPSCLERRKEMNQWARALELDITYFDAMSKHENLMRWIAETAQDVGNKVALPVVRPLYFILL